MSSRGSGNGQISDIITSTPNGDLRENGGPYSPHYCLSAMFIQVERGGEKFSMSVPDYFQKSLSCTGREQGEKDHM